jgi:DNA-binding IscR family transcriptional regulator
MNGLNLILPGLAWHGLFGPTGSSLRHGEGDRVSLLQIYQAIEGAAQADDCPLSRPACPFGACLFSGILGKLEQEFLSYLASATLADFVDALPYKNEQQ